MCSKFDSHLFSVSFSSFLKFGQLNAHSWYLYLYLYVYIYIQCKEICFYFKGVVCVFLFRLNKWHSTPIPWSYPPPLLSCSGMQRKSCRPLHPVVWIWDPKDLNKKQQSVLLSPCCTCWGLMQMTFRITSRKWYASIDSILSHSMHLLVVMLRPYVFSISSRAGVVSLL